MSVVRVEKNNYTAEPLYQWDLNQVLEIRGLSLGSVPEIHYTNDAMERAIVRHATMDAAGVIRVEIPNSMLQKPYRVVVYVCIYEGTAFRSKYKLEIPVKERPQPTGYDLVDDPEVYSFNALEAKIDTLVRDYTDIEEKYKEAVALLYVTNDELQKAKDAYAEATTEVAEEVKVEVAKATAEAVGKLTAGDLNAYDKSEVYNKTETYAKEESIAAGTKTLYGLDEDATPDAALQVIHELLASKDLVELVRYDSSGTFNPADYPTADGRYTLLLQGAGGSGAGGGGALGGGAGALNIAVDVLLPLKIYAVTVGAGGIAANVTYSTTWDEGFAGGDTKLGPYFAPGGPGGTDPNNPPEPASVSGFCAEAGTASKGGDSLWGVGGRYETSADGGAGGIGAGGGPSSYEPGKTGAGGDGFVIVYGRVKA